MSLLLTEEETAEFEADYKSEKEAILTTARERWDALKAAYDSLDENSDISKASLVTDAEKANAEEAGKAAKAKYTAELSTAGVTDATEEHKKELKARILSAKRGYAEAIQLEARLTAYVSNAVVIDGALNEDSEVTDETKALLLSEVETEDAENLRDRLARQFVEERRLTLEARLTKLESDGFDVESHRNEIREEFIKTLVSEEGTFAELHGLCLAAKAKDSTDEDDVLTDAEKETLAEIRRPLGEAKAELDLGHLWTARRIQVTNDAFEMMNDNTLAGTKSSHGPLGLEITSYKQVEVSEHDAGNANIDAGADDAAAVVAARDKERRAQLHRDTFVGKVGKKEAKKEAKEAEKARKLAEARAREAAKELPSIPGGMDFGGL